MLRGYDFARVEYSTFLLILAWALQQCSATALPIIRLLRQKGSTQYTHTIQYNRQSTV